MMTRRATMALGLGAAAFAVLPRGAQASLVEDAIDSFTGGAPISDGGVTLIAPEIAENGENVPIEIDAPGATEIMFVAPANPTPDVIRARFGPASGASRLSSRVRLGDTQEVFALAKMPDGSILRGVAEIRVTIGGCGG